MIWDARKLDDRAYHRRRAILGALGALCALSCLLLKVSDGVGDFTPMDMLTVAVWAMATGYFAWMITHEVREMRHEGGQ